MFKRHILRGFLAVVFSPLVAMAGTIDNSGWQAVTVHGPQGADVTLHIPVADQSAPYALTGTAGTSTYTVSMQFAQGLPVDVRLPH
jgi:hypothetical protein